MRFQKGTLEQFVIFLISPFLSIPLLVYNLRRESKLSLVLTSLFFGILSFLYIPHFSNDKTRYLERVEIYKNLNFNQFSAYLISLNKSDFIFDTCLYFFSIYNININLFFLATTAFTFFTFFTVSKKIVWNNSSSGISFNVFLILLFTVSLPGVFSGVRFFLAGSFFLWAVYYSLFQKKFFLGLLLLVISISTHFSLLFFTPGILFCKYFNKINGYYIFLLSLPFLLLPESVFEGVLGSISFSESYEGKIELYTEDEDILASGFKRNFANTLMYIIKIAWIYLAFFYLAFNKKYDKNALITKLVFILFTTVNLTHAFPTIFSRYAAFLKVFFVIFLINEYFLKQRNVVSFKKRYNFFFSVLLAGYLVDIFKLKLNFKESFFKNDILTIINIFSNNLGLKDVIP